MVGRELRDGAGVGLGRKLRVGGVPEHFNAPFHIGLKQGVFMSQACDIDWVEQACGTGEMVRSLREGKLDIAIALTEGLTSAIAKDAVAGVDDFRIVGAYTQSPLCWAINTHKRDGRTDSINTVDDLQGKPIGISRYGSGSHIMSVVMAKQLQWRVDNPFLVHGNFKGLRDGVNDGSSGAFMWETFTTKPYHDAGEVTRLGDITTPWPAFMIACRTDVLTNHPDLVESFIDAVSIAQDAFVDNVDKAAHYVANNYGNTLTDAYAWLSGLEYAKRGSLSPFVLDGCMSTLIDAGVIDTRVPVERLCGANTRFMRHDDTESTTSLQGNLSSDDDDVCGDENMSDRDDMESIERVNL